MEFNYSSQRFLLAFGATCILLSIMWCNHANALEQKEIQTSAELVDKTKPIVDDANTENDTYPATPEGVIEDFVKNNHSVKAMKRYYLHCEGIDCEGEVTPKKRFMGLFDYDLDPCTTEGLKSINTRVMSDSKTIFIRKSKNKAKVKVIYNIKGILTIACVPIPNVDFGFYKNWKGVATYYLVKQNNRWKISDVFIDIQPPLPKSEDWAINKIKGIIDFNKDNIEFHYKADECIKAIKEGRSCLIQRWDEIRQQNK